VESHDHGAPFESPSIINVDHTDLPILHQPHNIPEPPEPLANFHHVLDIKRLQRTKSIPTKLQDYVCTSVILARWTYDVPNDVPTQDTDTQMLYMMFRTLS
jgi:hypothetical protein